MKLVSTDQNQTNNLTSLIICFSKQRIYFYFLLLIFRLNPRHPLHIFVPGKRLVFFFFFDGVMYTYTFKYMYIYIYIHNKLQKYEIGFIVT